MCLCVYMSVSVSLCMRMHVCVLVCVCVCMFVHGLCVCVYVCVCVCVGAHAHIMLWLRRIEHQMARNPVVVPIEPATSPYLKYVLLIILLTQNAVLILSMRYSRLVEGNQYITTTAVVIAETMKMVICSCIVWCQQPTTSAYVELCHV